MADFEKLILMMEKQQQAHQEQMEKQQEMQQQQMERQREMHQEQMTHLFKSLSDRQQKDTSSAQASAAIPNFTSFDSSSELWKDYWSRYQTFVGAHSVPQEKHAKVFLTNQSAATYKLLTNLAAQESPPVDLNTMPLRVTLLKSRILKMTP